MIFLTIYLETLKLTWILLHHRDSIRWVQIILLHQSQLQYHKAFCLHGEKIDIYEETFSFDTNCDAYEIFSGIDTKTTSTYLESTMAEAGLGLPIVHDKYGYCHGRSTLSINYNNIAIYLNRDTELDKLLIES